MIKHLRGLDGLRAIAILSVVVHHSHYLTQSGTFYEFTKFLGSGVDLFFVISGFLITNILLNSRDKQNFFKNFYVKRSLRIIPLYYLILVIAFFIVPYLSGPELDKLKNTNPWPYWLFVSNYYIAARGNFQNGLVDLSWSLSVEEQFYIFWSVCVFYMSNDRLRKLAFAILIFSPLLRILLFLNGVNHVAIHVMSITRMDTLMMGSLLALTLKDAKIELNKYILALLVSLALFILALQLPFFYKASITYTLVGLIYTCLVGIVISGNEAASHSIEGRIMRLMDFRPLALIGIYSYGIYLFHNPIQKAFRNIFIPLFQSYELNNYWGQMSFYLVVSVVSIALAAMSFTFYEVQWLKFKKRFNS